MLLVLLAGSILYFIISLFYGAEFVVEWVLNPALEAVKVSLPAWQHPLLDVQVPVETYVVKQTYWGSPLQINTTAAAISLAFFLLALAVAISCITTFSRLWYMVGVAAFCGIVVLMRLEQLGIMGRYDNIPTAVVLLLVLPLSYYFHSFRPHTTFLIRLLVFSGLIALLAVVLGMLASVDSPVLYVVNYGLPAWLGLSFLLLILVGPEIIAGILYLITAYATPDSKGNIRHLLLASGLYLLNLLLYYLQERQYLDWDIYFIGPYWILLISIIAGLWTLRLRREVLGSVMQLEPYGLMLYISLAIVTISTLAYAAATANDPLLETFEDAILYTHMGMGAALLLYIIANFYGLLRENQQVYRVLYRPQFMPLFTARLAGIIIMLAFYGLRGNHAFFQPMAGYYNAIGDIYASQGDLIVSQNYYRLGSQYQIRNHRSNYALASLALQANQPKPAAYFLKEAAVRQPTPYSFANLANLYRQQGLFFNALFTLRQGIDQFPLAGPLYNNLGLSYGSTKVVDSAFYYLRAAAEDNNTEEVALTNMLAVLAQHGIRISPDSLGSWDQKQNLAIQNNLLALANRQRYQLKGLNPSLKMLSNDSSIVTPLYLLNYALQAQSPDTSLVSQVGLGYENAKLTAMEEQWGLAFALLLYQVPDYYAAFATMQDLADRSQFNNITYYKILGQWALEQDAPLLAAEWFRQAYMRGDAAAGFYSAIARSSAGQSAEATQLWVSQADTTLPLRLQQRKALALAALSNNTLNELPEQEELSLLRLHLKADALIPAEKNALLTSINNPSARAEALLHLAKVALQEDERAEAQGYLSQLQALYPQLSAGQQQSMQALRIRYKLQAGGKQEADKAALAPLLQLQLAAAEQLAAGNATATLQLLQQVAEVTPFEETAILGAVHLLNIQKQQEEAYAMLRRALQLNKYAIPLLEAYALQSLRIGVEAYAEEALLSLETLSPPERYKKFIKQYEDLKTTLTNAQAW